jgi:cytosine/adenosine deaminase-related metal-dependent hydrolase
MILYHARWVVPISHPPIEHASVGVEGSRIAYVGPRVGAPSGESVDLGPVALIPGLVNTHTHLELTAMRGFLENLPFDRWIDRLRRSRNAVLSDEAMLDSAHLGIHEGLLAGTTTYADTCSTGVVLQALNDTHVRGIMFQEVFGPASEECDVAMADLVARIERLGPQQTERVGLGISPHAPYTVSDALYRASARYAGECGLRMAMHIAESKEEMELVCDASGAFAEKLRARSIPVAPRARSPIHLLRDTGCLERAPLLIHCVRVDAGDIETMAAHHCTVAHCPSSNAKLAHGIAPLVELIQAGIPVGLGSDSVASNNRMSMLDEARLASFMQRARLAHPAILDARTVLELATIGGARALGLAHLVGTLEVGKEADLAAFPLDHPRTLPVTDVFAAIVFALSGVGARFVAVAGRPLVSEGQLVHTNEEIWQRVTSVGEELTNWAKAAGRVDF